MLRIAMLRTVFAIGALVLITGPARAILYNGSYTVTSNGNPAVGLAVMTINDFGSFMNPTTNSFTGLNVTNGVAHFHGFVRDLCAREPPLYGQRPRPSVHQRYVQFHQSVHT